MRHSGTGAGWLEEPRRPEGTHHGRARPHLPPDRRCAVRGDAAVRREGPGGELPADRAAAAAGGRAQRAGGPARRRGLRGLERVRWAVPDPDRRAAGRRRAEVQPVPHHGAVRADPRRAAHRSQPPHGRDGGHHRAGHVGPRLQLGAARTPARRWPRPCGSTATRPRSSASATRCRCGRPARSGRSTPGPRAAEASSTSTASSAARPTSTTRRSTRAPRAVEPEKTPEEGYHFTEDMTDRAIGWIRQQKSLTPDKPFFVYYAPGATHAPHHVPDGVVGQVPGPLRRRLGRAARGDPRPAEGARRGARRHRADRRGTTRSRRGTTCPRSSSPCWRGRWRCTPGSWSTPTTTSAGWSTRSRTSACWSDTLVYYIIGDNGASAEGTVNGSFNEMFIFNGADALETPEFVASQDRRARHPDGLQPLRRGLGARHGHAVPVDQAGRLPLGRHPQRHHRALARGLQRARARCAQQFHHVIDVAPTDPRGGGRARADDGRRRPAAAASRASAWRTPSTTATRRTAARTQYFEMFCNRGHLPRGLDGGHPPQHAVGDGAACRRSRTTSGSSTTRTRTGASRATSPPRCPRSSPSSRSCGWPRRGSTTCCRSTTAGSSGSTPTWPAGRCWSRGTPRSCSAAWAG